MPTLVVEDIPGEIYERIQRRAQAENRTLSEEVIRLLRQGVSGLEPNTIEPGVADSPRLPCPPILDTGEISPPYSLPRSSPGVEVPAIPGGARLPTSFTFEEVESDDV